MPEHDHTHRELFDEMLSLSANLGRSPPPASPQEPHIPVLFDVVDIPPDPALAASAQRPPPETPLQAWPDPAWRDIDSRAALEIESGFIVDALMDEFLPLLEARLRERLEQKQLELLASAAAHAAPPPKER